MATSYTRMFLNQQKYILELLRESNMLNYKPVRTPLHNKKQLTMDGDLLRNHNFIKIVGKLIYLTIMRPDISHVINLVSQFMHAPYINHMLIVKQTP